ncbi:topoisomerase DNA-binding C4 zinc finger domain-containing protein [Parendozoicomonas haliclonae]|uniref:topoisomerase DNA-binding C4 zinc finger domain-containing protein n=1 Tax=Parendozoicomonas haliclonae TaxID=1960125 RepID=UPI0039EF7E14
MVYESAPSKKNNERLCPKCGSALVPITSKDGTRIDINFLRCSQYPKCKAAVMAKEWSQVAMAHKHQEL